MSNVLLIDQGTYGCVFRNTFTCDNQIENDIQYISKLQLDTPTVQKEITIGKQIQQIPLFFLYFSPLLSSCPISISNFNLEKCNIFDKKTDDVITTKLRFIHSSLKDSIPSNKLFYKKIHSCYRILVHSIDLLHRHSIIHFDIKPNNIMYDVYSQMPILIDFGISFIADGQLDTKAIFYNKNYYLYWCVDIFICSFIVIDISDKTIPASLDVVLKRVDEFIENLSMDLAFDEIEDYHSQLRSFFKDLIVDKTWEEVLNLLLEYKFSWDYYSLAISCILLSSTNTNHDLMSHWKSIVFSMPDKRFIGGEIVGLGFMS